MQFSKNAMFAMLFGLILGDGWLSERYIQGAKSIYTAYNIGVSADKEDLQTIKSDCQKLFGDIGKATIATTYTTSPKYGISGTTSQFAMNKKVCMIFKKMGMPTGRRVLKEFLLPSWLVNSSKKMKAAFISGLYAAEGNIFSFQKNDKTLKAPSFTLTKAASLEDNFNEFAAQVSKILNDIGIEHNLKFTRNKTKYDKIVVEFVFSNSVDNILRFTSVLDLRHCARKNLMLKNVKSYYLQRQKHLEHRREAYNFTMEHPDVRVYEIAKKFHLNWSTVDNWRKGERKTPSSSRLSLQTFTSYINSSTKNPLNGGKLPA